MRRSKDKGTWAESAVAYYLQCNGWPSAERRSLRGNKDRGDITGTPGLCWEVKYVGANSKVLMSPWMRELIIEMGNCGVDIGTLVIKTHRYGSERTGQWYACMPAYVHDKVWAMATANGLRSAPDTPTRWVQSEANMSRVRMSSAALPHIHTYSPGYMGAIHGQYRTMILRDAVTLLRCAGYGDPPEVES